MTTNAGGGEVSDEQLVRRVAVLARLLDRTARLVWEDADALAFADPTAAKSSDLAMRCFLAGAQLASVLPDKDALDQPQAPAPAGGDPGRPGLLLSAAETLARDLPGEDQRLTGAAGVGIVLGDLVWEAARLGY